MPTEPNAPSGRVCRCGNPDCWRTAEAAASFDAFVAELIRRRGEEPPAPAR